MSGRGANMPGDRAIAAVEGGMGGALPEARGGSGTGARAGTGFWHRLGVWCHGAWTVVRHALRVVVAWCLGTSSWDTGGRTGSSRRATNRSGDPLPPSMRTTGPADVRRVGREVQRLMASLGSTAGGVAAYLYAAGATGVPGDAHRSPVGLFLSAVLGSDPDVAALDLRADSVTLYLESLEGRAAPMTVAFPEAVKEFAVAFDARCYPLLLAQPEAPRRPER